MGSTKVWSRPASDKETRGRLRRNECAGYVEALQIPQGFRRPSRVSAYCFVHGMLSLRLTFLHDSLFSAGNGKSDATRVLCDLGATVPGPKHAPL